MGPADDGFLLKRLRTVLAYKLTSKVTVSAGLQDSRAFDLDIADEKFISQPLGRPNNPYKEYLEPYDTVVGINELLGTRLSVKIGRQKIAYGNNRIFGPGEWGNSGPYIWDAALFSYKMERHFFDLFFGGNKIHDPEVLSWRHRHQFNALGSYSHIEIKPQLSFEPFLVFKFDRHETFRGESGIGDFSCTFPG